MRFNELIVEKEFLPLDKAIQTTDYTCGAACAASVFKYFGIDTDEIEVAQKCGTTEEFGTFPEDLVDCIKAHGLNAHGGQMEMMQVINAIKDGNPVFLLVQAWGEGHWVLAVGYNNKGFIINDPYLKTKYSKISFSRLRTIWNHRFDNGKNYTNYGIVVNNS